MGLQDWLLDAWLFDFKCKSDQIVLLLLLGLELEIFSEVSCSEFRMI